MLNDKSIKIFEGIPTAMDYKPYSHAYYVMVKRAVLEKFGQHANMIQATRIMNEFGNLLYFSWFPKMYHTSKEALGQFYNPRFTLAGGNKYADYLHGLTHIRSRSEHTNLGEALVIPDNYYTVGVRYQNYMTKNKDKLLRNCHLSPFDEFDLTKLKKAHQKLWLMNIRFDSYKYQNRDMTFYKAIYKENVFKADFPEKRASELFLFQPLNAFEKRLSSNVVRAIYMDEKFKLFSSQQKSFIHTPIKTSIYESYNLIFTNAVEDKWINKLEGIIQSIQPVKGLGEIINTTIKKDEYPQRIAANASEKIIDFFLM